LLLTLVGGEELLNDMFWSVLEYYAPQAFNEVLNTSAPLSADVNRRTEPERPDARDRSGDRETSRIDRLLSASRSPLVAWALLILAVIYFGGMKLESLEKENVELQHNLTALTGKVLEQNTGLLIKAANTPVQQKQSGSNTPPSAAPPTTPAPPTTTKPDQAQQAKPEGSEHQ
jgi:hypothetical protein